MADNDNKQNNLILWPYPSQRDVPAEFIYQRALERNFRSVVVIGEDKDEVIWVSSNVGDHKAKLALCMIGLDLILGQRR